MGSVTRLIVWALTAAQALRATYGREITNMVWLFADRFLRVLANFAIGIAAARLLGPVDYGDISYTQTILTFLTLLAAAGLNGVVVKRLIDQPSDAEATLGTAFALQALAGTAAGVITAALALTGGNATRHALLIAIVACGVALRPSEVYRYWFEANVNARRAVIADNIGFLVSGSIKIVILYRYRSVEAFVWTMVIEQLLGAVCLYVAYRTDPSRPHRWRVDGKLGLQLLRQAWPLLLSGIAVALYMRIDQFVIMKLRGPGETGIYAAAVRLSEMFYVLPTIVATSFFPRWQSLIGDPVRHRAMVQSTMAGMIGGCVIICLVVTLLAGFIVPALYGARFAAAVPVLIVHVWTSVFVSMGVLGNQWYLSHGLQGRTLAFTLIGAGCNLLTNCLLVPYWGALGAAIASVVAQIVSTFAADALSARTRPLFLIKVDAIFWPARLIFRGLRPRPPTELRHDGT
ncbi:PST family polysaccharide transporter [Sphingomonas sp. BK235]|nr:PST family polysaccharide transporter [Sphingomonas sp. BK235]